MGSRFSIGIFLLSSLWIVFPCIGYTQEKDTIPSMDIEEEELINTTCFPFAGVSLQLVPYTDKACSSLYTNRACSSFV